MGLHLGRLVIDDPTEDKLHRKHEGITYDDVVEAIQHPAQARAAWENHPVYGRRVVAHGSVSSGRGVICILKPMPEWDENADTWEIKTAHWVG